MDVTWQPISTAPKDGRRILVANSSSICIAEWWSHEDGGCWRDDFSERVNMMTHWTPLPEPPAATTDQAEKDRLDEIAGRAGLD